MGLWTEICQGFRGLWDGRFSSFFLLIKGGGIPLVRLVFEEESIDR